MVNKEYLEINSHAYVVLLALTGPDVLKEHKTNIFILKKVVFQMFNYYRLVI